MAIEELDEKRKRVKAKRVPREVVDDVQRDAGRMIPSLEGPKSQDGFQRHDSMTRSLDGARDTKTICVAHAVDMMFGYHFAVKSDWDSGLYAGNRNPVV